MRVLGGSPLGLVMDAVDNTKVKLGSQVLSTDKGTGKQMYTSLFAQDLDGLSTNKFRYRDETEDLYEISTQDIVEYCQKNTMMYLTFADFAYLKNLGVYPNNRLIIARRFQAPVGDDLVNTKNNITPIATLISWVPDNTEFFDVSFGEKWESAETSFKKLLDDASENTDIMTGDNSKLPVGTFLAKGANAIPLPGWSEGLQYAIFRALNLTDLGPEGLPFGNPNLIREAKAREIAPKDSPFSGFTTKISVTMEIEYEQKFISGIDPTKIYYDILSNALAFGTSESKFMFRADTLDRGEFSTFLNNLGSGDPAKLKQALQSFTNALYTALVSVKDAVVDAVKKIANDIASKDSSIIDLTLFNLLTPIVAGVISKYKVRILGILSSLTGAPSAPWHVTIGNPKRPIFSSGDMLVEDVKITFGKLLAYNDLPSSVKIGLTLTNARTLGAQEIFAKLSSGEERSYKKARLDFISTGVTFSTPDSAGSSTSNATTPDANSTPITGSGTNGGNENLENKSQSKSTSLINPNNPANLPFNGLAGIPTYTLGTPAGSALTTGQVTGATNQTQTPLTDVIQEQNRQCHVEYNYILGEIIKIVEGTDSYTVYQSKKEPLLEKYRSIYGDNETAAINELRLAMTTIFKAKYESIKKCPIAFEKMNKTLEAIYAAIKSRSKVTVENYEFRNNISYITKVSFNCNI